MKTNPFFAALLAAAGTLVAGWSLGQALPWGGAALPSGASDPIRCPARELLPRSSTRLAKACAHMERFSWPTQKEAPAARPGRGTQERREVGF
jgi:hypothetical protein